VEPKKLGTLVLGDHLEDPPYSILVLTCECTTREDNVWWVV